MDTEPRGSPPEGETILFLSDLHTRFELVNRQLEHAEAAQGATVAAVVLCGDLGLVEPYVGRFFKHAAFARPTYYLEGNHEDFDHFDTLVARYREQMTFCPRGSVRRIGPWRMLFLGGAKYMDAMTTPMGAEIEERDIEAALAHDPEAVDLVVTHDCPAGIGVRNAPGFEHYGRPGFERGLEIAARYRPRRWIFGHHHRWIEAERDGVHYHGLPQSWEGYALLEADGRFTPVQSPIRQTRQSISTRLWRAFTRRPPEE